MQQTRRRKVSGGAVAEASSPAAPDACNLEDTNAGDRWAGDPEESPADNTNAVPPQAAEPGRKDRHPMPWGLVITDVFNLDVHKTLKRLEAELSLGDGSTEYGTVLRAVDQSAKNLFEAARLARKAKLEDEKFALELDQRLEVLRSAAAAKLEQQKANGERSKAPTIKDIEDCMLSEWPDEMRSLKARKAEMHGAFRAIESLEMAWRDRCQSLRTLAQQFKSAGV